MFFIPDFRSYIFVHLPQPQSNHFFPFKFQSLILTPLQFQLQTPESLGIAFEGLGFPTEDKVARPLGGGR